MARRPNELALGHRQLGRHPRHRWISSIYLLQWSYLDYYTQPEHRGNSSTRHEVEVLNIDTAVQLFRILLKSGPESEFSEDESEIRNIVKELGFLPLAIEQAAAFIRESKRPIDEYLPLYQENRST